MQISPYPWEGGFTLLILEIGRPRLAEVIHLSPETASGKATVWIQGCLVPKAFSMSHMKRGWGYRDLMCLTNLSTRHDKNRHGYEGNTTV